MNPPRREGVKSLQAAVGDSQGNQTEEKADKAKVVKAADTGSAWAVSEDSPIPPDDAGKAETSPGICTTKTILIHKGVFLVFSV